MSPSTYFVKFLSIGAVWVLAVIAVASLTAWYRANQMKHFARHTQFDGANFRLDADGASLMWLGISNYLLSMLGVAVGFALGAALLFALKGSLPHLPAAPAMPGGPSLNERLQAMLILVPLVFTTTVTQTFAQFRSVRYAMSRLKLDGNVNLAGVLQSQHQGPRRGEGLAQVFDIDAF